MCVRTVLGLHCVWQLESVERCVYLIGSPFFTSSCTRTCHKDRQEMCSGTSSCVLSFTLSLTEIRTAESLRQQASLCVCSGHLCVCLPKHTHWEQYRTSNTKVYFNRLFTHYCLETVLKEINNFIQPGSIQSINMTRHVTKVFYCKFGQVRLYLYLFIKIFI